jgi:peptidoglycan-associated lipoprotein
MKVGEIVIMLSLTVLTVLTGCSSTDEKHLDLTQGGQSGGIEASTSTYNKKDVNSLSSVNGGVNNGSSGINNNQANVNNNLDTSSLTHTVYFLYDSSEVESNFMPLIEQQSQELLNDSDYTLVLEGHADERGSREYNIALGEERAKAVAKIMQARGVHANQLEIVSYGEEKPASFEHTETAWHLNRRVNLISQRNQQK